MRNIARLEADSRSLSLAAGKNEVVRQVTYAYYDYSFWTRSGQILNHNAILTDALVSAAETRYANGLGSAQDVFRATTTLARLENRKLQASQMQSSALLQIAMLTDDPSAAGADLPANLPEITDNDQDPADPREPASNPYLASSSVAVEAAEKRLSLAKTEYWPDLTLGLDYRVRKDIPIDPVRGEDFLSAKVGLAIPLWSLSKQKNRVRSQYQQLLSAEARRLSLEKQIEREFSETKLAMARIRKSIALYDTTVLPQASAALEAARIAYEVGQVDFNGLLAAQLELLEIELERIDLLRQYHQNNARLNELTGVEYGR
jgi:outer membrane protein TolC